MQAKHLTHHRKRLARLPVQRELPGTHFPDVRVAGRFDKCRAPTRPAQYAFFGNPVNSVDKFVSRPLAADRRYQEKHSAHPTRKIRSEEHTSELQSRFGISYA